MEEYFLIEGGKILSGEIEVRGCKNAATPIIAASLLTKEPCFISNLPLVEDIFRMLEIIEALGAEVEWVGEREVKIKASNINPQKIRKDLITKLRSSILIVGPLLARFKEVKLPRPGGCLIGARPLDAHLSGLSQLGAECQVIKRKGEEKSYIFKGRDLKPQKVVLPEFSVTATENVLLTASLLEGKTVLKIAALEPHVQDLVFVLQKMGAKVKWRHDHTIEVTGKRRLKGFNHFLIYDPTEAGSFLILASLLSRLAKIKRKKAKIIVKNVCLDHLELVILKLKEFGIKIKEKRQKRKNIFSLEVEAPRKFLPVKKVQVFPYPGIPTDLQCIFGVLASQSPGPTLIHDPMYEGRLKYLTDLQRMGAKVKLLDDHRAIVEGESELFGTEIKNYDLRSGAAFIVAGLIAKGQTKISNIYQVDRGYEKIEKRLQKIGAKIERIKK